MRAIEALVRNTLDGKGRAAPAAPPELSVVSEVLRTPDVRVQLQQKSAGSGKLIVEFADTRCAGHDRRGDQGCDFVLGMRFQEGRDRAGRHPSTLDRRIERARRPFSRYPENAT